MSERPELYRQRYPQMDGYVVGVRAAPYGQRMLVLWMVPTLRMASSFDDVADILWESMFNEVQR